MAPWTAKANMYHYSSNFPVKSQSLETEAARTFSQALSYIAGEFILAKGFGGTPPEPSRLGGIYAQRFLVDRKKGKS